MKKNAYLMAALLLLLPLCYLFFVWPSLPAIVPLHFSWNGRVDRYGSRNEVIILLATLSGVAMVLFVVFSNIHRLVPKKAPAENKDRMQKIALVIVAFMAAVQCYLVYMIKNGEAHFSIKFILLAVCLLCAVIGNYMPNLKPNYVAGFRLPWTLKSKGNWRKTHDVAGKLWFAGGLISALLCLWLPSQLVMGLLLLLALVLLSGPAIYSYRLFRKNNVGIKQS